MSEEDRLEGDTEALSVIAEKDANPEEKPPAKVLRDPVTGQFLPGTARGPGRPHGSKGKLNKTVVDTLSAIWERRGDEVLERLADENPAALAAIVSRLVPQDLVTQAITGEDGENSRRINNIQITLVAKQDSEPALPSPSDGDKGGTSQALPAVKH